MIPVAMFLVWLVVAQAACVALICIPMSFSMFCKFYNNVMSRTDAASTHKKK